MKNFEILVIGGGPAGITIAKILGRKKRVGVIRPEDNSMIYCAMPYVLEGLIPIEKTFKKDELITDAGANLIRDKVVSVSFDNKIVVLENGEEYQYDKLIIATGADPVIPAIENIDLKGIYTFKTQEDLKEIYQAVEQKAIKRTVIVGAGAIGIELAQALNQSKIECHLVDMAGSILPSSIDIDISKEIQDEIRHLGINLHLNSKVCALSGADTIENASLNNGENISLGNSGAIVFAIGMQANTELFKCTPLNIGEQGIVVNNKMETNIKDVYAVGDCVQFISGITGEPVFGKLATNAVPMARMLSKNLLGDDRIYKGFYNGVATKVGKYFVGATGLTEALAKNRFDIVTGYSELTTTFPIMPNAKMAKMKLITDKKSLKILGGQVVSEIPVTDKVDIITLAIQADLTVKDLTSLSYSAQPYQSFFPANNLVVACAEEILVKLKNKLKEDKCCAL